MTLPVSVRTVVPAVVALALVAAVPGVLNPYYSGIATLTLLHIGLAAAWNIAGGVAGQFSLGHSLFVAAGGVLAAALVVRLGWNPWLAMVAAAVVAGLIAWVMAVLIFRLRLPHLSFALITLALAEVGLLFVLANDFLGGASGVLWPSDGGPLWMDLSPTGFYWLAFVLAAGVTIVVWRLLASRTGFYLRAIRDDENAAAAVGIDVARYKTIALVLSAVLTAVVATVYSRYAVFVDPFEFAGPLLSISIILFVVVGGAGTVWGPVLGTALLYPTGELLRGEFVGLDGLHQLLFGLLILVVVLRMPRGLVAIRTRWRRPTAPAPEPAPATVAGGTATHSTTTSGES